MTVPSGQREADAIAYRALAEAAAIAATMSRGPEGGEPRLEALASAAAHLSARPDGLARRLGLPGVLILRHAAAGLRDERCRAFQTTPGSPGHVEAIRLHQALDTAATALGASPECFLDADDWGSPDEDGDRVDMTGLRSTARTGVMLAQGLSCLMKGMPGGGAMLRRDADCLLAGGLALQVACLDPAGVPRTLAIRTAEAVAACAERICATARSWQAIDPDGSVGRLSEVVETSVRFAGDVIAELSEDLPAPGF